MIQRPRDTIIEILTHKASSMLIAICVVAAFGIPLATNILITCVITSLTLIKDYFLRRFFYKRAISGLWLEEDLGDTDPYFVELVRLDEDKDDLIGNLYEDNTIH